MAWSLVSPEVINIPQPDGNTCWLACLQMLYVWKGKSADEPLRKLKSCDEADPELWLKSGIAPDDCTVIGRCLGLGRAGDGDADIGVLAHVLKTYGPYWAVGEWKKGYSHVKVIVGADPDLKMVKMLNPWNPIDPVDFASIDDFNNRTVRWKVFGSCMYWIP